MNVTSRFPARSALAVLALGVSIAGCGSSLSTSTSTTATAAGTPSAYTSSSTNPVSVPPVSDAALTHGSPQHQITETIVSFYRSAWEDDATEACRMFSPAGVAGFMHAAATSFPQAINKLSTCEHAMEIYNAALGESASTTADNDPSFSTAALDRVGVEKIAIAGNTATAVAPTNIVDLINPERFILIHVDGRWLINGSASLNKSNLPQILARAKAKGELTPKKRGKR